MCGRVVKAGDEYSAYQQTISEAGRQIGELKAQRQNWIAERDSLRTQLAERDEQLKAAKAALAGLYGMVQAGTLVRDCSNDADPKWFLTALDLTGVLNNARAILSTTCEQKEGK